MARFDASNVRVLDDTFVCRVRVEVGPMTIDQARCHLAMATLGPIDELDAVRIGLLLVDQERRIAENDKLRAAARKLKRAADAGNQVTMWAAIGEIKGIVEGDDDDVRD